LTSRTGTASETAEVAAAEAAAAEAAAAEATAAVEAAAAAGGAVKAAADAPGARAALVPEQPKEPGGGAGGMAEDAEDIPGQPVSIVRARVHVLAATAPGFSPRLVTNCGVAIVMTYKPHMHDFTVKVLALCPRLQTKFLIHPLFSGCTN
jgi:hypothetical protein